MPVSIFELHFVFCQLSSMFFRSPQSLDSTHGHHWMIQNQIDYILCNLRWKSSIESAETRIRDDCGSDHKLLIAKSRLKLKEVGKTTKQFR